MKKFMSGGGQESSSGGDFQTKMIAMAMSEAATLFDKSGNTGSKQDAVNGAATTMFKLLVQSKLTGGGKDGGEPVAVTGGSNSGGLGSLLSMVSVCARDCASIEEPHRHQNSLSRYRNSNVK